MIVDIVRRLVALLKLQGRPLAPDPRPRMTVMCNSTPSPPLFNVVRKHGCITTVTANVDYSRNALCSKVLT
jgi:hypothetical protein